MEHRNPTRGLRRVQEPTISIADEHLPTFDPKLAAALLDWYAVDRRELPWRRSGDPYAVWVSEVMLQQTRVATVIPYFERWLERFPDVRTLAAADEDEVLHCWQGLGYYSRARGLLHGARMVAERFGGEIPADPAELRGLPGIGPYTAGAIASIAFGRDEPAVDGNVVRVLCRLFALPGDPARAPLKKQLWRTARTLLPSGRAADFNQALMELGSLCCTPRSPRCGQCPVRGHCLGLAQGEAARYPELAPREKPTRVTHVAALVARRGKILMERVPAGSSWWAGMWRFPSVEPETGEGQAAAAVRALREASGLVGKDAGAESDLVHHVTRYRIHLKLRRVIPGSGRLRRAGARWFRPGELADLAIPAADRRLADRLFNDSPSTAG